MYKLIPGNQQLLSTIDGSIKTVMGVKVPPTINNAPMSIVIYGREVVVNPIWVTLISHFEAVPPIESEKRIWDVSFTDLGNSDFISESKRAMYFTKPMELADGYRVIPGFMKYAVNREGKVIHIDSKQIMPWSKEKAEPTVNIYNPDRNKSCSVPVSRLLALTWLDVIYSPITPIVDFINGDNTDIRLSNLRWVEASLGYSEEAEFIREFNNKAPRPPVECYNIFTKEVTSAENINQLARVINADVSSLNDAIKRGPNKLYKNFLVRFKSDAPWNLENVVRHASSAKTVIASKINSSEVKKFKSLREAGFALSIPYKYIGEAIGTNKVVNGWVFTNEFFPEGGVTTKV